MNHTRFTNKPRSEIERIIDEWCIGFTNCGRSRSIYKEFVLDGIPEEVLAEKYCLSRRQTQRIIYNVNELLEGKL